MHSAPGWGLAQMEWDHFPLLSGRVLLHSHRLFFGGKSQHCRVSTLFSVWESLGQWKVGWG